MYAPKAQRSATAPARSHQPCARARVPACVRACGYERALSPQSACACACMHLLQRDELGALLMQQCEVFPVKGSPPAGPPPSACTHASRQVPDTIVVAAAQKDLQSACKHVHNAGTEQLGVHACTSYGGLLLDGAGRVPSKLGACLHDGCLDSGAPRRVPARSPLEHELVPRGVLRGLLERKVPVADEVVGAVLRVGAKRECVAQDVKTQPANTCVQDVLCDSKRWQRLLVYPAVSPTADKISSGLFTR